MVVLEVVSKVDNSQLGSQPDSKPISKYVNQSIKPESVNQLPSQPANRRVNQSV
jgi:hypothetical protein